MKFIIPKNYDIKPKILGAFYIESIILTCIFIFISFLILSIFKITIINKISICIIINIPIFLLFNFGINNENIFYICIYIIKYIFSNKVYIYSK